jgi:hypothetical protein
MLVSGRASQASLTVVVVSTVPYLLYIFEEPDGGHGRYGTKSIIGAVSRPGTWIRRNVFVQSLRRHRRGRSAGRPRDLHVTRHHVIFICLPFGLSDSPIPIFGHRPPSTYLPTYPDIPQASPGASNPPSLNQRMLAQSWGACTASHAIHL